MKTHGFLSDAEVCSLVAAFETGELDLADFSHSAHMTVALAYLADAPLSVATDRMRAGLQHFLTRHGKTEGYHETLTLFWMRLLDYVSREEYAGLPLWERVNAIVAKYGESWPVKAHFSRGITASTEARQRWVAPDLLPVPF